MAKMIVVMKHIIKNVVCEYCYGRNYDKNYEFELTIQYGVACVSKDYKCSHLIVINPIFWLNEKTHNFPLMGTSSLYIIDIHDGLQLACLFNHKSLRSLWVKNFVNHNFNKQQKTLS